VYSPAYLPVSCCSDTIRFDGVGGAAAWDAAVLSPLDGARECEALDGEVGRADGGLGRERKARWSWSVGVRRVVARPERCSEGKCMRE
jgi:hypothetical protein